MPTLVSEVQARLHRKKKGYFAGVLQGKQESILGVEVLGQRAKRRGLEKQLYNERCSEMPFI